MQFDPQSGYIIQSANRIRENFGRFEHRVYREGSNYTFSATSAFAFDVSVDFLEPNTEYKIDIQPLSRGSFLDANAPSGSVFGDNAFNTFTEKFFTADGSGSLAGRFQQLQTTAASTR